MKRHSPVLRELAVQVVPERQASNGPVCKMRAEVETCVQYMESFEMVHLSFSGRAKEGCREVVVFKLPDV